MHSHAELKRFHIDFLSTAGKNRGARESREEGKKGSEEGNERGREETGESVALSVFSRGEWAELWGGCVVNSGLSLVERQMGNFPFGRSHVQL